MCPFAYPKLATALLLLTVCAATELKAEVSPFGRLSSSFTRLDSRLMGETVDKLLASGNVGQVASWKNDSSGNYGTMELERNLRKADLPCRQIAHVIKLRKERDPRLYRVVYCKVGSAWKIAP